MHSHGSVRLSHIKGNGTLVAVKNQGRKFSFRFVLFLTKKAQPEPECLGKNEDYSAQLPLSIAKKKKDYMKAQSNNFQ